MKWDTAKEQISKKITKGLKLNDTIRKVLETPATYKCKYSGLERGYKVKIGKAGNYIEIPWSMLYTLFYSSSINKIYNNEIFSDHYPNQVIDHDCYVHSVGQIFAHAGIAIDDGTNDFKMLDEPMD